VNRRAVLKVLFSFGLIIGGLYLLAFSTFLAAHNDPREVAVEQKQAGDDNLGSVIVAGLLISSGVVLGLSIVSPAVGVGRHVAMASTYASLLFLFVFHMKFFLNAVTVAGDTGPAFTRFTAYYFFHTGDSYSFVAVYILFLITVLLLGVLLASMAYLLSPERFRRAFGRTASWAAHESTMVTAALLTVLSLMVFIVFVVRVAVAADRQGTGGGLLGDNAVMFHYIAAFLMALLAITIGLRAVLVNWSGMGPGRVASLRERLSNVGRIERALLISLLFVDALLLAAPSVAPPDTLSSDPVFTLSSRTLAFFLLFSLVPYAFYALSANRLLGLVDQGRGPAKSVTPFDHASVRLTAALLSGIVLIGVLFLAFGGGQTGVDPDARDALGGQISPESRTQPIGMMIAFAAYASAVFLLAGVRFGLRGGVPTASLRGEAGAAPFFAFMVLGLATAFMLWGAGNSYVAAYAGTGNVLAVENQSVWGADVLARFTAALGAGFIFAVGLSVLAEASRVRRSLLGPHLSLILAVIVGLLVVFTVSVWSSGGAQGTENAYAGFAFHKYRSGEKTLVAFVLLATTAVAYTAFARVLYWATRRRYTGGALAASS
jgi:hypothetical protein